MVVTVDNPITLSSNIAGNSMTTSGPVTLTAGGGNSGPYTWVAYDGYTTTTLASNTATATHTPIRTTRYTATIPAGNTTCSNTAQLLITIGGRPLPVELISFNAAWTGKATKLTWATASEKNSAYFSIERSIDGSATFQAIGKQTAAGTSTSQLNYQFLDNNVPYTATGTVYYRLRQVDLTGEASYSEVRTVQVSATANAFNATVFPNPYEETVKVQFTTLGAGAVTLTVHDVVGKTLLNKTTTYTAVGTQELSLPQAATWPTGVYYLTIRQGNQQQVVKINHR
ncbi:T9SS type A sorting domain-containing protein [Hymenobacter seoulensis]